MANKDSVDKRGDNKSAKDVELIKVTQIKSSIGSKPKHRGSLRALGLRGIGMFKVHNNSPEIRGMISRVSHLVKVEQVVAVKDSLKKTPKVKAGASV